MWEWWYDEEEDKEKEEKGDVTVDAKTITNAIKTVSNIVMSDSGQKFLCGTYSNGDPRSVVDAMRDEYVSPDDRANWDKKEKMKKKKKKKKQAQNCDIFRF